MNKGTRYLLAAVQAIVGYEWLISGANKVFSGAFPQGLAGTLSDGLRDNPNGWYVGFLRQVVIPHGELVGYLIQYCELLSGIALLAGALVLCGRLPRRDEPRFRLALAEITAAVVAATACAVLCISFHFWMGDGLISAVNTARPFDEGIDLDTLMAPLALVIAGVNARLLVALVGDERVTAGLARLAPRWLCKNKPALAADPYRLHA